MTRVGNIGQPMTDGQIEEKFRDLSNRVISSERSEQIIKKCWDIERVADCRELVDLMIPG